MVSFIITLSKDRIKLETRADKLKEVERRSLRIVQVERIMTKTIIYNICKNVYDQLIKIIDVFCLIIVFLAVWNRKVVKYFASF